MINSPYNSEILRTFDGTALSLPYSDEGVLMGQNEFLVSTTFNNCIDRVLANLKCVYDNANIYNLPPVSTLSPLTAYDSTPTRLGSLKNVDTDGTYIYLTSDTTVSVYTVAATPAFVTSFECSDINETLTTISSMGVTSDGKICMMDSDVRKIIVINPYNPSSQSSLTYYSEWGGFGGVTAISKFRNPNDLYIDSDNYIYIADTGNKCVKKYTDTGAWLDTFIIEDESIGLDNTTGIISVCVDYNGDLQVLTPLKVFVFNQTDKTSFSYILSKSDIPTSIRPMENSGFVFITYPEEILKLSTEGKWFGEFSDGLSIGYKSLVHIENTLYVTNENLVSRFTDYNRYLYAIGETFANHLWSSNECNVDKDENIQDWVMNRCFHRVFDNIEIVKRCLLGKFELFQRSVNGITQDEVVIADFTASELSELDLNSKGDIYIGINELVTSAVINRCLKMLNDNIKQISYSL